jgi:hypothetical protein
MKKMQITVLAVALALCGAAFAQHGHGMGGPSMASGMGEGGSHRMSPSTHTQSSSTHGVNMDQLLKKNTALADKIHDLTGMSAQDACSGFKNLGQSVAAAHVSKNLGITFGCMKADMTGVAAPSTDGCPVSPNLATGKGMSLGKAIQTLQPTANSKLEAKKGQKQADQDIKETSAS